VYKYIEHNVIMYVRIKGRYVGSTHPSMLVITGTMEEGMMMYPCYLPPVEGLLTTSGTPMGHPTSINL
jgi:hypothetical protein